ncbi:hypothetical protein SO3561_09461 [Streptomyces olivochromogenes]|uniref:Uncharacterized protein n=1 Tax=Streptomyces olivochromogenes TaxID=1963 RepID=A0A250VV99_STROL|nr:hypothetical protein SO3561_09461 [Streptomyces olivochromogenes]
MNEHPLLNRCGGANPADGELAHHLVPLFVARPPSGSSQDGEGAPRPRSVTRSTSGPLGNSPQQTGPVDQLLVLTGEDYSRQ